MNKYTVIIEKGPTSWSAYVPDLPGCAAVGATIDEVRELIAGAIDYYIEDLRNHGEPVPEPTSHAELIGA